MAVQEAMSKILTYGRYVGRPMLWPELWRRGTRRLRRTPAPTPQQYAQARAEGEAWCRGRAVAAAEALARVPGGDGGLVSFAERFPAEMEAAGRRVDACPLALGASRLAGAANLDLLYSLAQRIRAGRVIETGVAYGWSSLALLLSLRERPGARLFSVDLPYLHLRNDPWVGVAVPPELRGEWRIFRMADREGLPRALRAAGTLDLAHYDSDKSYEGRSWAYPRIWSALRPGGVLVSDDVGDNVAFRDFSRSTGVEPMVVENGDKYQGILVRPAAGGSAR